MRTITVYDSSFTETASYTLENHGIPYFGHTYSCQIEDTDNGRLWEDTNVFSVLNKDVPVTDRNSSMYFDWSGPDGRIYRYAITNIADMSGQSGSGVLPYTTFTGTNKLAYDLSGINIEDKSWVSPTLKQVAEYVFGGSGWNIGECDSMGINTDNPTNFEISGASSAQDALSSMVTAFGCELRAYIEVDKYGNVTQTVDVVKHLQPLVNSSFATTTDQATNLYTDTSSLTVQNGSDTTQGRTIEYRAGLAGFERQEDRTAFYTRLYPLNMNGSTIQSLNGNSPYLVDQAAQDYWLGADQPYRTLKLQNEHIANKSGLIAWAKQQIKIYNHPAFTYTITTAFMDPDDMPLLGTTNLIANFDVQPTMTVLAEVVQVEIHDDAPTNNVVIYGEYRTLNPTTPMFIDRLRTNLANAVAKAQQDASSVKPASLTPDGNNFTTMTEKKRLIMQAWEGGTNLSAFVDNKGFIWRRHNADGTVDPSYKATGYLINVPYSAVGTLSGTIETGYIQNDPEISLDVSKLKRIGNFSPQSDDGNKGRQYMVPLSNGQWLGSQVVQKNTSRNTVYTLHNADFTIASRMIVVHGGHGASFNVEEADGKFYIWGSLGTDAETENYSIARFPYVGGATLQSTDSRIKRYITANKYLRVSVDFKHGYVLTSDRAGNEEVLKLSDVKAGNYKIVYSFNIGNYGFHLSSQTYQSQTLSFPYVIFHSGNINMKDDRMVYGVNCIHKGEEFSFNELQDWDTGITDDRIEPETCCWITDAKGNPELLISFNCRPDDDLSWQANVTRLLTIPIITRPEAPVIDETEMEDDDNGDD